MSEKKTEAKTKGPHQYVQTGGLKQSDLVCDGEGGETWQPLGKFYYLDDAFGGELAKLVP